MHATATTDLAPTRRRRIRAAAGLAAVALVLLGACSGGRPSSEELVAGLTASSSLFPVAEQQAECAADLLLDSDLTDDALRAVADADPEAELTADERTALARLQVALLTECTS